MLEKDINYKKQLQRTSVTTVIQDIHTYRILTTLPETFVKSLNNAV